MGEFVAGDVVITTFPFSDLSATKRRPALVLAEVEFGNLVLCQITSKPYSSRTAIALTSKDFAANGLPIDSFIRPDKLFTAEPTIIEGVSGKLNETKLDGVLDHVRALFEYQPL